jgi:hypothetical protein
VLTPTLWIVQSFVRSIDDLHNPGGVRVPIAIRMVFLRQCFVRRANHLERCIARHLQVVIMSTERLRSHVIIPDSGSELLLKAKAEVLGDNAERSPHR